jgi:hypothetical protein
VSGSPHSPIRTGSIRANGSPLWLSRRKQKKEEQEALARAASSRSREGQGNRNRATRASLPRGGAPHHADSESDGGEDADASPSAKPGRATEPAWLVARHSHRAVTAHQSPPMPAHAVASPQVPARARKLRLSPSEILRRARAAADGTRGRARSDWEPAPGSPMHATTAASAAPGSPMHATTAASAVTAARAVGLAGCQLSARPGASSENSPKRVRDGNRAATAATEPSLVARVQTEPSASTSSSSSADRRRFDLFSPLSDRKSPSVTYSRRKRR